jgi:uncharacterized protein YutE (UPF0331/DUF86 family)
MPIDQAIVKRLLGIIQDNYRILSGYQKMPLAEFHKDEGRILAVMHGLQLMIQALIDIGLHICAATQSGNIETYRDSARNLLKLGFLSAEQSRTMEQMIGLRNILVYGYAGIEENRLMEFLQNNLDDFLDLAGALEKAIAK